MLALLLLAALASDLAPAPPPAPAPISSIADLAPVPGIPTLLQSGVPPVPQELRERAAQYQNARSAALLDAAPAGDEVLVATRFAATSQLHAVSRPLGMRRQLTFLDEPVSAARYHPADPQVLFYRQDRGGGEAYQLYRLDRRTGRSELLTDGKSRHQVLVVSPDARWLAYSGTGRNGEDTDVWLAPLDRPREARLLVEADGTFFPSAFSPDGRRLLVVQFRSVADADLHLVDVETGARRQLTPAEGKGGVDAAAFSADGRAVWFTTDRHGEFRELYRVDLAREGAAPEPMSRSVRWDVEELEVALDGSRVAFTVNADGLSHLYLLEPRTRRLERVPLPKGIVGALRVPARRATSLYFALQSARSPSDLWRLDLRTRKVERWTESEVGGLDTRTFVEPELVRYPSTDGVTVPAFLYRPPPARHPGKRPVVVMWHGGPEGQSRPHFSGFPQLLAVELGIAVLQPNVRGSSGYGKGFLALDDGVRREASLADVGATLDFLARDPAIDPARVAVYGASYGGYLALASLAFHGDRVRAGVSLVGISSIPTFLERTEAYRRDLRRVEYGDERVPEIRAVQERISPLGAVDRIRSALLVQQGKNDPRVPQSESEQIVNAVREKGREVWYLLALDEGHGFAKKGNRDHATLTTLMFLDRTLREDAASEQRRASP